MTALDIYHWSLMILICGLAVINALPDKKDQ
jgi:hypothetical protein